MKVSKIRFGELFEFQKKSPYKAGEGLSKGTFPFYTSSNTLSKFIDEAFYESKALTFGTGGNASVHYCNQPFSTSTDCVVAFCKDESITNVKFVYYYLQETFVSLKKDLKVLDSNTSQKNL